MENIIDRVENAGATAEGILTASEYNNSKNERQNCIVKAGLAYNSLSAVQLPEALSIHAMAAATFVVSGTAQNIELTMKGGATGIVVPSSYALMDSCKIRFKPLFINTLALTTINIGQTAGTLLGSRGLKNVGGADIEAWRLSPDNFVSCVFNLTLDGGLGAWEIEASSPTETTHGEPRAATAAEMATGSSELLMVTPKSFNATGASEIKKGTIELATAAEANAGTDAVRAITPATLAGRTATETRSGGVELATAAEANAGADAVRAITPATLAGRTATETRSGGVELATQTETNTGTDTTRAVTPATLAGRTATTTRSGGIEIATQAEVDTGTDAVRAVTPATLAGSIVGAWQTPTLINGWAFATNPMRYRLSGRGSHLEIMGSLEGFLGTNIIAFVLSAGFKPGPMTGTFIAANVYSDEASDGRVLLGVDSLGNVSFSNEAGLSVHPAGVVVVNVLIPMVTPW